MYFVMKIRNYVSFIYITEGSQRVLMEIVNLKFELKYDYSLSVIEKPYIT